MTSPLKIALTFGAVFACMAAPSSAAVLVLYNFDGLTATSPASTYTSADTDPNSTVGTLTPAAGLGTNGNWTSTTNGIDTLNYGDPLPAFAQKALTSILTQQNAYDNNSYLSFTITPSSGYELDLTNLTFVGRTANTNFPNFYLSSSIGGFQNPIGTVTTNFSSNSGFTPVTFDLSGVSFQNRTLPVEFRLYLWWNSGVGTSAGSATRFDNITLNGTVSAIPEPGSSLLIGFGLALILWKFRRS